jgi:ferritin-like metal-binding protein YciE
MQAEELKELLVDELKDLYNAENQLIKALPRLAKAARSPELKQGFEKHLAETREHAHRIEQICEEMDETPKGSKCKAMEGLIEEGKDVMEEQEDSEALDAALICAAQKVEHYEIASYGTAKAWAELLEMDDAVKMLDQTLNEEKATDEKLNELAESINLQAVGESE